MAIGYAKKNDMLEHEGHELEVAVYGDAHSVTIECIDCATVLIDSKEDYEQESK